MVPMRKKKSLMELSHVGPDGRARMVDVTEKPLTSRMARAEARVKLGRRLVALLRRTGGLTKGNVTETARLAGIQAAKQTALLIPLCHPLPLDSVEVEIALRGEYAYVETVARTRAPTGVEMEAMTAAAVAALTVYDMCKAAEKGIAIESVYLVEKRGGRSGHWQRSKQAAQ